MKTAPHIRGLLCFMALWLGLVTQSLATPTVLFILDGSGSMWGRVGGEAKIDAAKRVMDELLAGIPAGIDAGLMAYGHRRKGDCSDIQVLATPGSPNDTLRSKMHAIEPHGRTPIAASLRRAGDLLKGREDRTTLVLVSDGLETCGGDPCAVARALHEQGHHLVVHVVGFGVSEKRSQPLRCIARSGGGRYFPAADAAALQQALMRVRKAVVEHESLAPEPPPVVAEVPKDQATKSRRIKVIRTKRAKVKVAPASWVSFPPRFWGLLEVETGKWVTKTQAKALRVKAGEYQVGWRETEHATSSLTLPEVLELDPGVTISVPIESGIQLFLPKEIRKVEWVWLQKAGDKPLPYPRRDASAGAFAGKADFVTRPHVVAPGTHHLWFWQNEHQAPRVDMGEVRIEPGQLKKVAVDSGFQVRFADWLEARSAFWEGTSRGRWNKAFYRLRLVPTGSKGKGYVWAERKGPWIAPPGDYEVYVHLTEHGHNRVHWGQVKIPAHGFVSIPIDSGVRVLPEEQGQKPPYRLYLTNLDTGKEILQANAWTPLPAPPGRYRLDWRETEHGAPRETLIEELSIEPGSLVEVEL